MKCVIVGGVAGGATAAARIRRNTETKLIHTKPGIGFILTDEKP